MPVPAEVVTILGKTGMRGIYRVRCKVVSEQSRNKVIVRNVLGPVRVGDVLMISEVEMEAASVIG